MISPCLAISIIRNVSKVKWSNPRKGLALFFTPWCSSYWKGDLQVAHDYGHEIYLPINLFMKKGMFSHLPPSHFFFVAPESVSLYWLKYFDIWNMNVILNVFGSLGTINKELKQGLEDLEINKKNMWKPSKLQHCWDRTEYREKFWRLEEISSEKPSAKSRVKNSQKSKIIITIIIMELPNHDRIRTLGEKETYKYLGILEADTTKQVQMKDTTRKEYLRRTRKLHETKVSSRNLIKGINTWAVPLVRYSGPFLKWTREELKQMDQRTRKLMTMHKALHPRDDFDRLYASRKEGGRELASIEDTVDASIQRLEDYIEKHERGLITTIRNDTDNTRDKRVTTTRKQKWEGKQLYGRFKRLINNISHQKTCTWLRKGNFKRETNLS